MIFGSFINSTVILFVHKYCLPGINKQQGSKLCERILVGTPFGCVDVDIESKNILKISFDIYIYIYIYWLVIFFTKKSESGIVKKFCCTMSLTANIKGSVSK